MGFFNFKKKKSTSIRVGDKVIRIDGDNVPYEQLVKDVEKEVFNALSEQIVESMVGAKPTEEELAAIKEREQKIKEGKQLRKERMEKCGIEVSLFTEDKAKTDLSNIINTLIPSFSLFQSGQPRFEVDFSDLTKTGKAPKNVCTVHLDTYSENVFWIAHIKYLASGIVNMIDLHLWKGHIRHGVSIRTVNNEYRITAIIRQDTERDISDTLFLDNKPTSTEDQISILDSSINQLFT